MEGMLASLALLCLLLTVANAVTVTIPKPNYEVAKGDNITIPCSFSAVDQTKLILMQWTVRSDGTGAEENDFIYYPDGSSDIPQTFTGRVTVNADIPNGKFNLNLFSVAMTDQGTYKCHLLVKSDTSKSAANTYVLVLVAPSIPQCNLQGKAEYGQNINLTCLSTEGSPAPTYTWQSLDVQNNPRPMDPKTTSNAGILSLYNISKDTSGYYICTSANKIRSAKCNFTLSVMPPSMNIGSTAGIVAGVAIFVLVIGIIICCCCCRKKDKDEGYSVPDFEDHEDHDKNLAKNGDGRGHEEVRTAQNTNVKSAPDRQNDEYENQSERGNDRRSDYDDRRSDYDDRRSDYDDRRSDYDDRRRDYDDRRRDYDDRRRDYDDRRSDYSDRRDKYGDRQERYDDNRRYDDDRRYNDRRDGR
ncbi:cell surface A33 antigen-like isoform X1 [Betta splendens]|uniref:Cell surface A33 antigen-like isoform X1 n=1 Tax=Betta splendens TaxID=158456 RepID=A0A6P7M481_BETSP|nr:cell surface A33 antigen-like isoform X1 [Betta splendens]